MKQKQGSQTAIFVAIMRALGHRAPWVPGFRDPTAEVFLGKQFRSFEASLKSKMGKFLAHKLETFWSSLAVNFQFRTVILDQVIENSLPFDQLVILGAGYDGRAWRLESLKNVKVFEVDHPATQEVKKKALDRLVQCADQVQLLPIDFTTDDLGACLDAAGFDSRLKTVWIWEGVVMYLTAEQIRQTMACIAGRSSKDSRLALSYLPHGLKIGSRLVSRIGEPMLTVTAPGEFGKLAEGTGWKTESDSGVADWRRELMDGNQVWFQWLHPKNWYERIWVGVPTIDDK
ncbi:MAG: class I SAM-dependent methyltransferase [Deltaproteobacteria bacterium]|nr:class I SAM-dependent methyltransferase [Deltaproteobacteria bacterium]